MQCKMHLNALGRCTVLRYETRQIYKCNVHCMHCPVPSVHRRTTHTQTSMCARCVRLGLGSCAPDKSTVQHAIAFANRISIARRHIAISPLFFCFCFATQHAMACTDTYMHAITWSNEANRSKPEHRHTVSVVCVCSLLWTFRYIQRVFFCFLFASASTHALRHSRWLLVVLACLTNDRHNH